MQSELIGSKFVRVVRKKRPQWHLEEEEEEEAGEALSGWTIRQTNRVDVESCVNLQMHIHVYILCISLYIYSCHVHSCLRVYCTYNHHTRPYPIRLVVCWMLRSWCLNACMGGQKHINVVAVAVVVVALQSLPALHIHHHRLPSSKPNMQVNASNDWISCFLFLLS